MTVLVRALFAAILLSSAGNAVAGDKVAIPALNGRLQLDAYWFPVTARESRPAVIVLHGCGGMLNSRGEPVVGTARDASYFNAEKIHLLALDSFGSRGVKSICEILTAQRPVREIDRVGDVFAAISWLAGRPDVDSSRIVVLGRSHGAQTALIVVDRTNTFVQAQPIQPRAAIALYPGCTNSVRQQHYDIGVPLLIMIGELDDWTPAHRCVQLRDKLKKARPDVPLELIVFPGSYHGFDGAEPLRSFENLPNLKAGKATVGANPEGRDKAHRRTFEFLSEQFGQPLQVTHEQRMAHRYVVPPESGFARGDQVDAVPLSERGRARYQYYLGLDAPKAFIITEKAGWHMIGFNPQAMRLVFDECRRIKLRCWLYAVDDRVVWERDVSRRVGVERLRPNPG